MTLLNTTLDSINVNLDIQNGALEINTENKEVQIDN